MCFSGQTPTRTHPLTAGSEEEKGSKEGKTGGEEEGRKKSSEEKWGKVDKKDLVQRADIPAMQGRRRSQSNKSWAELYTISENY